MLVLKLYKLKKTKLKLWNIFNQINHGMFDAMKLVGHRKMNTIKSMDFKGYAKVHS